MTTKDSTFPELFHNLVFVPKNKSFSDVSSCIYTNDFMPHFGEKFGSCNNYQTGSNSQIFKFVDCFLVHISRLGLPDIVHFFSKLNVFSAF